MNNQTTEQRNKPEERKSDEGIEWAFLIFYPNGQLEERHGYRNGETACYEDYHENGQLSCRVDYEDHERIKKSVEYHENGQVAERCTYKKSKTDGSYELDGLYEKYDENGNEIKKCMYKNGKEVDMSCASLSNEKRSPYELTDEVKKTYMLNICIRAR